MPSIFDDFDKEFGFVTTKEEPTKEGLFSELDKEFGFEAAPMPEPIPRPQTSQFETGSFKEKYPPAPFQPKEIFPKDFKEADAPLTDLWDRVKKQTDPMKIAESLYKIESSDEREKAIGFFPEDQRKSIRENIKLFERKHSLVGLGAKYTGAGIAEASKLYQEDPYQSKSWQLELDKTPDKLKELADLHRDNKGKINVESAAPEYQGFLKHVKTKEERPEKYAGKVKERGEKIEKVAEHIKDFGEYLDPVEIKEYKIAERIDALKKNNPAYGAALERGDLKMAIERAIGQYTFSGDEEKANKFIELNEKYDEATAMKPDEKRGFIKNILVSTLEMLPPMAKTAAKGLVPYVGQAWAMSEWAEQGTGMVMNDLRKAGVSFKTGRKIAPLVGLAYAAVENVQVGQVFKLAGNITASNLKKSIVQTALKILREKGEDWLQEVGEEGVQQFITDVGTDIGKKVEGLSDKNFGQIMWDGIKGGVKASIQSMGPMGILSFGGSAVSMAKTATEAKAEEIPEAAVVKPPELKPEELFKPPEKKEVPAPAAAPVTKEEKLFAEIDKELGFDVIEPEVVKPPKNIWEMTYNEVRSAVSPKTKEELSSSIPILKELYGEELKDKSDPWGIVRAVERGDELPRTPVVDLSKRHKSIIKDAISKGKTIPPEVMMDYPELSEPEVPEAVEKPAEVARPEKPFSEKQWTFTVKGRGADRTTLESKAQKLIDRDISQGKTPRSMETALDDVYELAKNDVTGVESIAHFNSDVDKVYAPEPFQTESIRHYHLHGDELAFMGAWTDPETGRQQVVVAKADIPNFGAFNDTPMTGHEWTNDVNKRIQNEFHQFVAAQDSFKNEKTNKGKVAAFGEILEGLKENLSQIEVTLPNGKKVNLGLNIGIGLNPKAAETALNNVAEKVGRNSIYIDNDLKKEYNINDSKGVDLTGQYYDAGLRSTKLEARYAEKAERPEKGGVLVQGQRGEPARLPEPGAERQGEKAEKPAERVEQPAARIEEEPVPVSKPAAQPQPAGTFEDLIKSRKKDFGYPATILAEPYLRTTKHTRPAFTKEYEGLSPEEKFSKLTEEKRLIRNQIDAMRKKNVTTGYLQLDQLEKAPTKEQGRYSLARETTARRRGQQLAAYAETGKAKTVLTQQVQDDIEEFLKRYRTTKIAALNKFLKGKYSEKTLQKAVDAVLKGHKDGKAAVDIRGEIGGYFAEGVSPEVVEEHEEAMAKKYEEEGVPEFGEEEEEPIPFSKGEKPVKFSEETGDVFEGVLPKERTPQQIEIEARQKARKGGRADVEALPLFEGGEGIVGGTEQLALFSKGEPVEFKKGLAELKNLISPALWDSFDVVISDKFGPGNKYSFGDTAEGRPIAKGAVWKDARGFHVVINPVIKSPAEISRILIHEVMGHAGSINVLKTNPKVYKRISDLYRAARNTDAMEKLREKYAEEMAENPKFAEDIIFGEWIAYSMEDYIANPNRRGIGYQVWRAIRQFLIDMGLAEDTVEDVMHAIAKDIKNLKSIETKLTMKPMMQKDITPQPVDKTFIAVHNLNQASVEFADKLGGLPAPSMAITKPDIPFESYGDVTLIANKKMITPETLKVFNADIYSGRSPAIEYDASKKDINIFNGKLWKARKKYQDTTGEYYLEERIRAKNKDSFISEGKTDPATKGMFLEENGVNVEPVYRPKKAWPEWTVEPEMVEWYKGVDWDKYRDLSHDDPYAQKVIKDKEKAIRKYIKRKYANAPDLIDDEKMFENYDRTNTYTISENIYQQSIGKKEIDKDKTNELLNAAIEKAGVEKYEQWLNAQADKMFVNPHLEKGGRKVPVNLENMVDVTISSGLRGKEKNMVYGLGQARGAGARRLQSIQAMHKEKGRIVTKEKAAEIYEANQNRFFKLQEQADRYYRYPRSESGAGMFDRLDDLSKSMGEYLKGAHTTQNMMRALYKNDYVGVSESLAEDFKEFADDLGMAPTQYFEAKPERAVYLKEFAGAVIPKNTSDNVRKILDKNGIISVEYDPEKDGDRTEKIKEFSMSDVDVMFQKSIKEISPTFYSPLQKAVSGLKQEKGTGDQMFAMITKTPGVKEAEWKWMGLDDFLKGKQSVTKAEIEEFVGQNQVEIKEVEKGKEPFKSPLSEEESARLEELSQATDLSIEEEAEYKRISKKFKNAKDVWVATSIPKTKFSQYTLPGGENYREVLLTLPQSADDLIIQKGPKEFYIKGLEGLGHFTTKEAAFKNVPEEGVRDMKATGAYKSSHWDEPNVIAHVRMNDRTGPNGEKVLFVEEIQSDWAREARERGTATKESLTENDRRRKDIEQQEEINESIKKEAGKIHSIGGYKISFDWYDPTDIKVGEENVTKVIKPWETNNEYVEISKMVKKSKEYNDFLETQKKYKDARTLPQPINLIPAQPFLKNWEELTLKRVLRMAAEEGYDRVAWINGEQTADRYDLSKQIESVKAHRANSFDEDVAQYELNIDTKGGQNINDVYSEKELADTIGKDLATKIINDITEDNPSQTYSGIDLKIGGEWAVNLYDRIIPKFFEKYGKKWNVKVELVNLGEKLEDQGDVVLNDTGPQQSIPITQAMRDAVLYEGQPMFQKGEAAAEPDIPELQDINEFIKEQKGEKVKEEEVMETALSRAKTAARKARGLESMMSDMRIKLGNMPENLIQKRVELQYDLEKMKAKHLEIVRDSVYDYLHSLTIKGMPLKNEVSINSVLKIAQEAKSSGDLIRAVDAADELWNAARKRDAVEKLKDLVERKYRKLKKIGIGTAPATADLEHNNELKKYLDDLINVEPGKQERVDRVLTWLQRDAQKEMKGKSIVELPESIQLWAEDPTQPIPGILHDELQNLFKSRIEFMSMEQINKTILDIQSIEKTGRTVRQNKEKERLLNEQLISAGVAREIIKKKTEKTVAEKAVLEEAYTKSRKEKRSFSKKAKALIWNARDIDRIVIALTGKLRGTALEENFVKPLARAYSDWKRGMKGVDEFIKNNYADMDMKKVRTEKFMDIEMDVFDKDKGRADRKSIPITLENAMLIYGHSKDRFPHGAQREHLIATISAQDREYANSVIDKVVKALPEEYKKAVENQWKYYAENQWGRMNRVFGELRNINMDKVDHYIPLNNLDNRFTNEGLEADLMARAVYQANVRFGATKTRIVGENDINTTMAAPLRHLRYFDVIIPNMKEAEHYIAFGLPIRDTNRLLKSDAVKEAMNLHDPAVQPIMRDWLKSLAYGKWNYGQSNNFLNTIIRDLRSRAGSYQILGRVTSLMVQASSFFRGLVKVSKKEALKSMGYFISHGVEAVKTIDEKSANMATRTSEYEQAISEFLETIDGKKLVGSFNMIDNAKEKMAALIGWHDKIWAGILWHAKYSESINRGMNEDNAIYEADKLVRTTQSGGGLFAANAFQRGTEVERAFTQYLSDSIKAFNMLDELVNGWKDLSVRDRAMYVAFGMILPALVTHIIRGGFEPLRNWEEFLRELFLQNTAAIPLVGQIMEALVFAAAAFSRKKRGIKQQYKDMPEFMGKMDAPAFSIVGDMSTDLVSVLDFEKWKKSPYKNITSLIDLIFLTQGLPGGAQIKKTLQGTPAFIETKDPRYLYLSKTAVEQGKVDISPDYAKYKDIASDAERKRKIYKELKETNPDRAREYQLKNIEILRLTKLNKKTEEGRTSSTINIQQAEIKEQLDKREKALERGDNEEVGRIDDIITQKSKQYLLYYKRMTGK